MEISDIADMMKKFGAQKGYRALNSNGVYSIIEKKC
jgi:hypothetical protein